MPDTADETGFGSLLLGECPLQIRRLWEKLYAASYQYGRWASKGRGNSSGVDAYFTVDPAKRSLKVIYANIDPTLVRFAELDRDAQDEFRDALDQFIRTYAFLSPVMPYTDESLERLYGLYATNWGERPRIVVAG